MLKSGAVDIAFASSPTDPAALHTWSCFATHSVFVAGSGYDCDFDTCIPGRRSRSSP